VEEEAVEDHLLPDHHNMHKDSTSYLQQVTSK
jgi:hypothetical protein